MSEFSALLVSDLILLCSSIVSHPLYFSYFIFFFPYLFKILSFLSPLFVTTTLFILSFFTLSPCFANNQSAASMCHLQLPESKIITSLHNTYRTLVETLRSEVDHNRSDCFGCLELLEAYKMVFETPSNLEITVKNYPCEAKDDHFDKDLDEKSAQIMRPETIQVKAVVKIFEEFLQEKEGVENNSWKKTDKQVKSPRVKSDKGEVQKQESMIPSTGSKAMCNRTSDTKAVIKSMVNSHRVTENGGDYNYKSSVADKYQTMSVGNSGLMRKEKEWKRTLACKLFEERHADHEDGDEGMDLLWEAYETESNEAQLKRSPKKGGVDYNGIGEYDYDEECFGQLCCLQALKFSAGKMNLGMGRSNIVKISKALKGFGWLHHVSNRHGKKRYPLN
ncbi:hypothetical protein V6N13_007996 [Hibiscus sabdariffa]|uniref:Uncharacterized protein n=1 Tax=Hibiscus sabdariffa TaxID=183260 RepID=A0ABR2EC25_9ROSI